MLCITRTHPPPPPGAALQCSTVVTKKSHTFETTTDIEMSDKLAQEH